MIPVADLERGVKSVVFPISADWLNAQLSGTEARATGPEGRLEVELKKNGQDVLVRGTISVQVTLPCARTLDPAVYDLRPELFLLLSRAPTPGSPAESSFQRRRRRHRPTTKPRQVKPGKWADDPQLSDERAANDTFDGDEIVLDGFVREFILLELPMFPLRQDLRSVPDAAIGAPPEAARMRATLDPRLAPLKELKRRLVQDKE